jgi:hypothetical protein
MRITRTRAGALVLAFVLVSFAASMAFAQVVLPNENHYKVYNSTPIHLARPLTLSDQFGRFDVSDLIFDRFSTPAEKILEDGTDYPIIDPVVHMDWWRFAKPVSFKNSVIVTDQFGQSQWVTGNPAYLLTPSLKNVTPDPRGGPPPPVWNHYVCYDVISGPLMSKPVTLVDQFGTVQVVVLAAKYFCNPAEKNDGGKVFPIIDKGAHLACYLVDDPVADLRKITTIDQFGFWQIEIAQNDCLCVPALMDTPVPTRESTWGRIKALYRN